MVTLCLLNMWPPQKKKKKKKKKKKRKEAIRQLKHKVQCNVIFHKYLGDKLSNDSQWFESSFNIVECIRSLLKHELEINSVKNSTKECLHQPSFDQGRHLWLFEMWCSGFFLMVDLNQSVACMSLSWDVCLTSKVMSYRLIPTWNRCCMQWVTIIYHTSI